MKSSVFLKIFAGYLLIAFVLTGFILVFSFRAIRNHHMNTLSNDLENLGATLKLEVLPLFNENRVDELDALVKNIGRQIQTRITVIDSAGTVLADSEKDPKLMEKHRTRPEIIQALKGRAGRSVRFSTTVREEMLYVALPLEENGRISGVLRVSLFLTDINRLLNSLRRNLVYTVIIVLAVSLLGAAGFSRSLSRPIRELSAASRKVASGDFDVSVFLKSKDELRELADSFNYMTGQLKTLVAELSNQKEELNSLVSSLHEGLVVIDKNGKIVQRNKSFEEIVRGDIVDERFYWEVLRDPRFAELIRKTTDRKRNVVEEIPLGQRIFLCSATFLEAGEQVVVIFHDITEMKDLEKMKRDFVTNVSHELRTPLTAIKGFAETLEGLGESNQRYVDIIRSHTDRLINIVNDLLLLSELEERGTELEIEAVNVRNLVEDSIKIFDQRLKEKNLNLVLRADDNLGPIEADPFRLQQAFLNLIDNAIKYTEKGEITIWLKQEGGMLVIEIQDTGTGIPEDHLPRIFERFYVVDKARSKRLAGTGLGLSIVRHIVLLHNGKIEVESSLGVGTRFTITLPIIAS